MSVVLKIWVQPVDALVPTSVYEAMRLIDSLQNGPSNPQFAPLVQRLTARFPCITSAQAESIHPSRLAWTDGPLEAAAHGAVASLGINSEMLDEAHSFVVETANSMGFNVMDEQSGACFMTDGSVLHLSGAISGFEIRATAPEANLGHAAMPMPARERGGSATQSMSNDSARSLDAPELLNMIAPVLTTLLSRHGFVPQSPGSARGENVELSRCWGKHFDGGRHELWLQTEVNDAIPSFYVTVNSRLEALARVVFHAHDSPDAMPVHLEMLDWLREAEGMRPGRFYQYHYEVHSMSELSGQIEHLTHHMQSRLVPLVEQLQTVQGLDTLVNTQPLKDSMLWIDNGSCLPIYVAAMAQNPRLDAICQEVLDNTANDSSWDNKEEAVKYVVDRIAHARSL